MQDTRKEMLSQFHVLWLDGFRFWRRVLDASRDVRIFYITLTLTLTLTILR